MLLLSLLVETGQLLGAGLTQADKTCVALVMAVGFDRDHNILDTTRLTDRPRYTYTYN